MRKILTVLLILFIGFITPVLAENEESVLPSETGAVMSVENIYSDDNPNQQGTQQIVKVKILSGEYKGQERDIINILTENPAYDIQLKKGDKVVLHLEEDPTGGMNFFIADLKRDSSIMLFAFIFCAFLAVIGRKKGVFSLFRPLSRGVSAKGGELFFHSAEPAAEGVDLFGGGIAFGIAESFIVAHQGADRFGGVGKIY